MNCARPLVEPSNNVQGFQEIIRTRKQEYRAALERKRNETVKRIEEMRLRNAKESEQEKLFGLPNEMWAEILSHVEDHRDLESMWGVHPRFRDLSGKSKSQELLLSKLLSIEELPYLWKEIREKLYHCKMFRTFSQGMRNVADRFIENHGKFIYGFAINLSAGRDIFTKLNGVLANFREGPVEARAKRVFHRKINLHINPIGVDKLQFDACIQKIKLLLETIGDQILEIRLTLAVVAVEPDGPKLSFNDAYILSGQLLGMMSNLKVLDLYFYFDRRHGTRCSPKSLIISPETFENSAFPCLPRLKKLDLEIYKECRQKSDIMASVLRSNSHLKSLKFEELPYKFSYFSGEAQSFLPMLDLDELRFGMSDYCWKRIPKPLSDQSQNWKLKAVDLLFHDDLLKAVFNFVNHFPSLENLNLCVNSEMKSSAFKDDLPALILPNLTSYNFLFELQLYLSDESMDSWNKANIYFFFSLQFLLNSKKLKSLEFVDLADEYSSRKKLRRFMINHECGEETINFRAGFRDLTYSNLWDVFPELEYVQHSNKLGKHKGRKYNWIRRPKLM